MNVVRKIVGAVTNFPGKNLPRRIKRNNNSGDLAFPLRLSRDRSAQYGHQRPVLIPLPSVRCAANNGGTSAYGMSGIVSVPMPPAAPSGLTGTAVRVSKRASVTPTGLKHDCRNRLCYPTRNQCQLHSWVGQSDRCSQHHDGHANQPVPWRDLFLPHTGGQHGRRVSLVQRLQRHHPTTRQKNLCCQISTNARPGF